MRSKTTRRTSGSKVFDAMERAKDWRGREWIVTRKTMVCDMPNEKDREFFTARKAVARVELIRSFREWMRGKGYSGRLLTDGTVWVGLPLM